jgi:hypothetical protein
MAGDKFPKFIFNLTPQHLTALSQLAAPTLSQPPHVNSGQEMPMRPPSDQIAANTTGLAPTGHLSKSLPKPAATLKGSHLITENKPLTKNSVASFLALPAAPKPDSPPLPKPSPKRSNPATRHYLRDAAGAKCASLNPTPAQN